MKLIRTGVLRSTGKYSPITVTQLKLVFNYRSRMGAKQKLVFFFTAGTFGYRFVIFLDSPLNSTFSL
jgi:hypothetical protein